MKRMICGVEKMDLNVNFIADSIYIYFKIKNIQLSINYYIIKQVCFYHSKFWIINIMNVLASFQHSLIFKLFIMHARNYKLHCIISSF
jgi:hypothetical protein